MAQKAAFDDESEVLPQEWMDMFHNSDSWVCCSLILPVACNFCPLCGSWRQGPEENFLCNIWN